MARPKARISTEGKPWARYVRLSKAEAAEDAGKTKEERLALTNAKLDTHLAQITAWMDRKGIPYSDEHIYRDPGLSAWKRGVRRPEWEVMMACAERGELAGIGVVAVDRFTRDITTMEDLIRLAETTDVKIGGSRAGWLDLTTYDGIQQARGAANHAAAESLATSFRLKETLGEKMRAGQPMGGGRPYGFETGGVVQRPTEVAVIRELAQRMLAGEPLQHLAADLNDRGLTTNRGGDWTGANLGRMLGLKRYGGEVEHHGDIVGTMPGEPVLDRDTYDSIQAMLTSRRRGRRPSAPYLLTGVLVCSNPECGGRTMNGGSTQARVDGSRPRVYRCPPQSGGCGRTILAEPVEQKVGDEMVQRMADPKTGARIAEEEQRLSEARKVKQDRVEAIEQQLVALEVKRANEEVIEAAYEAAKAVWDRKLEKARAERDALASVASANGIVAAATRTMTSAARRTRAEQDWYGEDTTQDDRRALLQRYRLSPVVDAKRPGTRRIDLERVRFE